MLIYKYVEMHTLHTGDIRWNIINMLIYVDSVEIRLFMNSLSRTSAIQLKYINISYWYMEIYVEIYWYMCKHSYVEMILITVDIHGYPLIVLWSAASASAAPGNAWVAQLALADEIHTLSRKAPLFRQVIPARFLATCMAARRAATWKALVTLTKHLALEAACSTSVRGPWYGPQSHRLS